MAARYSIAVPIFIQRPASTKRPVSRLLLQANNHVAANTTSLEMRSSSKMKVFEDRSRGIVCYRDDNGEITCEGYDEGPRFHQQISLYTCNPRDTEIIELLQRCLQIDGGEYNHGDKGVNDINRNGFNTFY